MGADGIIGHGIRRYTGNGVGMAHRDGIHPMCRHEHGGAVLLDANEWRIILRCCGFGTAWIWAFCSL